MFQLLSLKLYNHVKVLRIGIVKTYMRYPGSQTSGAHCTGHSKHTVPYVIKRTVRFCTVISL